MTKVYDVRLTDEAKQAMMEFKKAVYNLYVNYDQEVMADGKPVDSLWQLHNDIQDWGMVDYDNVPYVNERVTDEELAALEYKGETVSPDDIDDEPTADEILKDTSDIPFNEDIPLIDKVSRVLSQLRSDTCIDVVGSLEYNYTAREVIKYIRPLLNDERVMYDVFHNPDNEFLSLIRIY